MANAALAIDGHVHLYDVYDLSKAVEKGTENLIANAKIYLEENDKVVPVWFLVERSNLNFFNQIYQSPENYSQGDVKFKRGEDSLTINVEKNNKTILYMFAGRQLVTREGLEVLSLISDLNIVDRQKPIGDVIKDIKNSGGIPTLNWAPGKWFFSRGKVIARQIQENSPADFFIGETTLRNTLWREPNLIARAKKKGFAVIAGSDPLPFKGEENNIGSYGFLIEGKFVPTNPAQSLQDLMNSKAKNIRIIGKRNDVFTFTRRQYKIMAEKRTRG